MASKKVSALFTAFMVILLTSCADRVRPTLESVKNNQIPHDAEKGGLLQPLKELNGWSQDTLDEVWPTWLKSCNYIQKVSNHSLKKVCLQAVALKKPSQEEIRNYFETHFQAMALKQIQQERTYEKGSTQGLITGYYEPMLKGSFRKTNIYQYPLYRYPPSWQRDTQKIRPTRAQLSESNILKGLEIVWVSDPVEAAFMQIQGAGKIALDNGEVIRLAFDGTNNQPFQSFANWLIQKKEMTSSQASMQGIMAWAKAHPTRVQEMLNANPRVVFFKRAYQPADSGPIGALGEPLTAQRSIAVDWNFIPKGSPIFLQTTDPITRQPIQRLVFAQDTGNAIVGSVRADYYWGSGPTAGEKAGMTKQTGSMWLLQPTIE